MSGEPGDFDMAAALLRRAGTDTKAFVEALAARLEAALPGRVEITRRRNGLFSSNSSVSKITVGFDTSLLILSFDKGRLHGTRAKVVRGVTINTEEIGLPAWIDDVVRNTSAAGTGAGAGYDALHEFLMA